jgi:tetratricopeptide (TPR) repeat protein
VHGGRALHIALDENEPYSEVLACMSIGRTLISLKRYPEAVERLRAAYELTERNGYAASVPHITGLLAAALARSGSPQEAIRLVLKCIEAGHVDRSGTLEIYYLKAGYAEALFHVGDTATCFKELDEAIAIGRGCNNPCLVVQGLGLRARLREELEPNAPAIALDRAEQEDLRRRHALAAW